MKQAFINLHGHNLLVLYPLLLVNCSPGLIYIPPFISGKMCWSLRQTFWMLCSQIASSLHAIKVCIFKWCVIDGRQDGLLIAHRTSIYHLLNPISLAIYYYLVDIKYKYIGLNNFSSIFLYIKCVYQLLFKGR